MSGYAQQIRRELEDFQNSVQKLSVGIKSAASIWKDPKYSELLSEISRVASQSKSVLLTGDKSCENINKFYQIASEEF